MKLLRSSSMALLLAALFFTSCKSKSAKDLIVNKWTLTDVSGEGIKNLSEDEKKEMLGKFVMDLTKDGKVSMTGMGETPKTGTYTLSEDGKTLFLTRDGDSNSDPQEINELKEGKLVITSAKEQMKLSFTAK
jgi:hypothetical protein